MSDSNKDVKDPRLDLKLPGSAMTPEVLSFINQSMAAAVKEAVAGLAPILASIAVTPEKIAQAEELRRAPSAKEAAAIAREKRERLLTQQEAEENAENLHRRQKACAHKYSTGVLAVSAVNNFPDRQPRFLCHLCMTMFTPREWRIGAPDAQNPRGKPFIAPAHPMYDEVAALMSTRVNMI